MLKLDAREPELGERPPGDDPDDPPARLPDPAPACLIVAGRAGRSAHRCTQNKPDACRR
jgi:hypothetical protein